MQSDVRLERGSGGRRLAVSRVIDAPTEVVWNLLTDTAYWPDWGPSVRAVECSDGTITAGSTGRVKTSLGIWIPFEVTSCDGYRWTWNVAGIPSTGHRVEGLETDSRVVFELPIFGAAYVPICQRALEKIARLADEGL
ncbi:SRPBCC family protein [Haladaptatus caseinilyticus]|uniref:SRPBCC family protein n=1 Tax=Haladaptatus caseinilyticus TaxID=2993314 RepID=UPI00224B8EE4|nr:SRPBCC family protein [Haladaptatus caseinilyticus]